MTRHELVRGGLVVIVLSLAWTGCSHLGAAQQVPVSPLGTADLRPTQPDPSAGLVTVRPGFDAKKYPAIAILAFPVTDSGVMNKEEAKLTVSIPPYFQLQIVQRLRATNAFTRVDLVSEGTPAPAGEGLLRLEGRITRLAAGDDTSVWVPFSGYSRLGDRMKAQIETSLVDAQTGQVMAVTADRREAPNSGLQTAESYVEESFQAMARDLVLFLERLSKGEVARSNSTSFQNRVCGRYCTELYSGPSSTH
jgi:hypothetical protein